MMHDVRRSDSRDSAHDSIYDEGVVVHSAADRVLPIIKVGNELWFSRRALAFKFIFSLIITPSQTAGYEIDVQFRTVLLMLSHAIHAVHAAEAVATLCYPRNTVQTPTSKSFLLASLPSHHHAFTRLRL
jgi:hypothetical protein